MKVAHPRVDQTENTSRIRWDISLIGLIACVLGTWLTQDQSLEIVGTIIWLIGAAIAVVGRFGGMPLWNPAVVVLLVGVIPSCVPLLFFRNFDVGLAYNPSGVVAMYLTSLTAMVAVLVFFAPKHSATVVFPKAYRPSASRGLTWMGVICLISSIAASLWVLAANGIAYLDNNPEAARAEHVSGSGLFGTIAVVGLLVGAPMICLPSIMGTKTKWGSLALRLMPVVAAMVLLGLGGTRLILIRGIIILAIILPLMKLRRMPTWMLVTVTFVCLWGLGFLGQIRYVGAQLDLIEILGQRFSSDPQVAGTIVQFADDTQNWNGYALIQPFEIYLPGGSHPAIGEVLKDLLGLDFSGGGISTPLPAEGYLDFGIVGVPTYGALAGIIGGMIWRWCLKLEPEIRLLALTATAVTLGGCVSGLGTTLALYVLPLLSVIYLCNWWLRYNRTATRRPTLQKSARSVSRTTTDPDLKVSFQR